MIIYCLTQSFADRPDLAQSGEPPGLLTPAEQGQLSTLKAEKRRREWLLGRWTAKRLLQAVIRHASGVSPALDALTIGNDSQGAPYAIWEAGLEHWASPVGISISHSGEWAFCATSGRESWEVGADVEGIEKRPAGFAEEYFTEDELARVAEAPAWARDVLICAIWSAKEAALKALHLGLSVDTRAIHCLIEPDGATGDPPETWSPFTIFCDPLRLPEEAPPLQGWWRRQDGYVFTLAVTTQAESENWVPTEYCWGALRGRRNLSSDQRSRRAVVEDRYVQRDGRIYSRTAFTQRDL